MAIIAKKSDSEVDFEPVPAGTFPAVCYAVWDIGMQKKVWNNVEKMVHQVIVSWEIDKLIKSKNEYDGKRYVISKRYTLSLGDKANLRKDLESWRGKPFNLDELKGFDISKLVGINCLINIAHNTKNDKTYANVTSVMKQIKGAAKLTPENSTEPPEWVCKLITPESVEQPQQEQAQAQETAPDNTPVKNEPDDVPFDPDEQPEPLLDPDETPF